MRPQRLFMLGMSEGEEKRNGNRFGFAIRDLRATRERGPLRDAQSSRRALLAPLHQSSSAFGNRCRAMRVPVVKIGPRLAPDRQRIFKAVGGDKGDLRAFALEQRIGRNGRPVADFEVAGSHELAMGSMASRIARAGSSGVEGSFKTSSRPPLR